MIKFLDRLSISQPLAESQHIQNVNEKRAESGWINWLWKEYSKSKENFYPLGTVSE
jgi:hypothetical protein